MKMRNLAKFLKIFLLLVTITTIVYVVKSSTSEKKLSAETIHAEKTVIPNKKIPEAPVEEVDLNAIVGKAIIAERDYISIKKIHKEIVEMRSLLANRSKLQETAVPTPSIDIKKPINCTDKDDSSKIVQHGNYWLLRNYVKASNKVKCHESITYTTHCEFRYLDNVIPLLERWQAPLSIALWAPGDYFSHTLNAIAFYRKCHPRSSLVQQFATFHIFFEADYMPKVIPQDFEIFYESYVCPVDGTLGNVTQERYNLTYPVNVGRNLARDAALTHYVLASDIELYPSRGIVEAFFKMLEKSPELKQNKKQVFVFSIFEIEKGLQVPGNKTELISLHTQNLVLRFHYKICAACHATPQADEWIKTDDGPDMKIFTSTKRQGKFATWEPIYIGTNFEPLYDERVNWEGKSDKMTQAYIMCVLDYDFHLLSNAFLVHKPGFKTIAEAARPTLEKITVDMIRKTIRPEIDIFYGGRQGC